MGISINVIILTYNTNSIDGLVKNLLQSESSTITYNFSYIDPHQNSGNNNSYINDKIRDFLIAHSSEYTLITSNNVISNSSPTDIRNILYETIINNNNGNYIFDVCYVSKWLDNCLTYNNQFELNNTGTTLVRTSGPKGFETILFSPRGAVTFTQRHTSSLPEAFNSYLVQDNEANALITITFIQSPIMYNPLKAMSVSDYIRTTECESVSLNTSNSEISNLYIFYFVLVIIIVFLLAWLFFKLGPTLSSSMDDYPFLRNPLAV